MNILYHVLSKISCGFFTFPRKVSAFSQALQCKAYTISKFECTVPSRPFSLIEAGSISSLPTWSTQCPSKLSSLSLSCSSETHSPHSCYQSNWIISLLKTLQYIFLLHTRKTNVLNVLNKGLDHLAPAYSSRCFCLSHCSDWLPSQ